MSAPLATLPIAQGSDVVAVRQRVRRIAGLLGLEQMDQTRLATAVSEIARNAHAHASGGRAEILLLRSEPRPMLTVRIIDQGPGIVGIEAVLDGSRRNAPTPGFGFVGARRLCDRFAVDSTPGGGTTVELGKLLPPGRVPPDDGPLAALVASVAHGPLEDAAAVLHQQNNELRHCLDTIQERQDELDRLNRELEDTNRGVVALYAELDAKAAELRRVSDMKSRFISNISHEFRTPLNSVLALSRLLLGRTDGDLNPEQEKQVRFIRQSADSLLALVNDLLDIAKIEAGKVDVRPSAFAIAELFADLRGVLKPLNADETVELSFVAPPGLPALFTDEAKLAQILRNLVANALKFTERGQVRVAVEPVGASEIAFRVTDTGIGISPADQERIFEEFEQVESGLQARNRGTGLGLPLSSRLARLLGGTLTVSSTPGVGSTFCLTLPLHHPSAGPAVAGLTATQRVLVIDDEETSRYLLRRLIASGPGWEVSEAADGLSGLRCARETTPDVILLDLQMPGLDGFAVLRELAADPATAPLPVVICTSMPLDAALRQRLPAGMVVLCKSALHSVELRTALAAATAGTSSRPHPCPR